MFFKSHKPRYPRRPTLPFIRRKNPVRYHMKHQFGVREVAFLQTMHALTGAALEPGNRIDVLKNGVEIFPSMLAAVREAKQTITMESYIYWDGEIARTFAEALAERARAGVSVDPGAGRRRTARCRSSGGRPRPVDRCTHREAGQPLAL